MRLKKYLFLLCIPMSGWAQQVPSTMLLQDGIHHWNLLHPNRSYMRYAETDYENIADNLIAYQNLDGGWLKNIDWLGVLNSDSVKATLNDFEKQSTLDNRNTFSQIEYLADTYVLTNKLKYRLAVEKGLDYLLDTQKENGGWRGWDVDAVTFNDDVTTGAIELCRNILQGDKSFLWLDKKYLDKIKIAYIRGINLKNCFKRMIDCCLAMVAIVVLSPVMAAVAVLLAVANKGAGVVFTQTRPGKNGRLFKVMKFKTMTDERDENGNLLPDAQRLTKTGKFIRSTSLDELPQLFNVLKGDMALIGPRPLLPQYLPLYSKEQARRHDVRPGITGWAQVHGRNAISWKKKFELDVWYVDHCSFWLDLKIILLTVKKVVVREGITKEGQATTEFFNGNN